MALKGRGAVRKLGVRDQARLDDPLAEVVDELEVERPPAMARSVRMDQRVDLNVLEACGGQHAGHAAPNEQVDAVRRRVRLQSHHEPIPFRQGRVADMSAPVGLVQSHHAAGLDESDHLRDDLLGLGDVHEDEAGGREIERRPG